VEADANGDGAASGREPFAVDPLARLHSTVQRNKLRQVTSKEWFRCRSCGNVAELLPEAVLREGNVHDPRGPSQGCPACRSRSLQWMPDYVHRKLHSMPPGGVGGDGDRALLQGGEHHDAGARKSAGSKRRASSSSASGAQRHRRASRGKRSFMASV
jgi:hypothetical protein